MRWGGGVGVVVNMVQFYTVAKILMRCGNVMSLVSTQKCSF